MPIVEMAGCILLLHTFGSFLTGMCYLIHNYTRDCVGKSDETFFTLFGSLEFFTSQSET